jgi:hypothetical protein
LSFAQTRVHIAAQGNDLRVRSKRKHLRAAARRRGADARAARQLHQTQAVARNDTIAGVFAFGNRRDRQTFAQFSRKIFETMHRKINFMREQGVFNFFREYAQAAKFGKRTRLVFVARCFDNSNFDFDLGRNLLERGGDIIRLPLRERRAACADHKGAARTE